MAGCFRWHYKYASLPSPPQHIVPARRVCDSAVCGALFEAHRGTDMFLDFDEAVAMDDAARREGGRGECVWPGRLTHVSACWVDASKAGARELTRADACRFLRCRAEASDPSAVCVRAVCGGM